MMSHQTFTRPTFMNRTHGKEHFGTSSAALPVLTLPAKNAWTGLSSIGQTIRGAALVVARTTTQQTQFMTTFGPGDTF
jgi:hypothetical protein